MATANVAEKPLGCRIDPADDPCLVEDVARDADALQSLLDVAADCQARGHHPKCGRFDGSGGGRRCHSRLKREEGRFPGPPFTLRD